jgi:hypothetical protein
VGLHRFLDDPAERQWIAVAIAILRVRRDLLRLVDGVLEDVEPVEIDPHVLVVFGERVGSVQSKIREIQAAAHAQQIAHANLPARVLLALMPFLDRRKIVDLHLAALHDDADERRRDAFAGRPADLRGVLRPARRVALADDLAAMHDDHRARVVFGLLEAPVERGVDAGVRRRRGIHIAHRPGRGRRVRQIPRHRDRLEMQLGFAARHDRAALIAVEPRHAGGDPGATDRDALLRVVHGVGEGLVPAEVAERGDVLRDDFVGGPLRDAANDPQPRADVMRADRRTRFQAVVGVLRGRHCGRPDDQQRDEP